MVDKGYKTFKHTHKYRRKDLDYLYEDMPSWWKAEDSITLEHSICETGFRFRIVICKECRKIWLFQKEIKKT